MATIAFDTLKLARRLEAVGVERKQAEGFAEAVAETIGEAVVTREHLDLRVAALDQRIVASEASLKVFVAESRTELLKWMIGLLLGQAAIIATLVKLL